MYITVGSCGVCVVAVVVVVCVCCNTLGFISSKSWLRQYHLNRKQKIYIKWQDLIIETIKKTTRMSYKYKLRFINVTFTKCISIHYQCITDIPTCQRIYKCYLRKLQGFILIATHLVSVHYHFTECIYIYVYKLTSLFYIIDILSGMSKGIRQNN